jgi:hypothetical protein
LLLPPFWKISRQAFRFISHQCYIFERPAEDVATGPDQGFLVSRLVLTLKPWERGWPRRSVAKKNIGFHYTFSHEGLWLKYIRFHYTFSHGVLWIKSISDFTILISILRFHYTKSISDYCIVLATRVGR